MSAAHDTPHITDNVSLGSLGQKLVLGAGVLGLAGLGGAAAMGSADGFKHFQFAYLVAFMFFLSISLGALFFVVIQHLVRAGWSVSVRRLAELLAGNLGLLFLLSLPIVVPMLMGNATVYEWVDEARVHQDHLLHKKAAYLNTTFFAVRWVIYFAIWAGFAHFFLKNSAKQDQSGDPKLTSRMQFFSAPATLLFALSVSFAAFDFLMSLEPRWFSTIFGIYFFAGCALAFFAAVSLFAMVMQKSGRLTTAISTEHYQDLGKFLFAFVFFWGYIAFSQFMLIWYANIPEETEWYHVRMHGGWATLGLVLVFGHFIIPFAGLLSKHVKRNRFGLALWAIWALVMHYIDLYWVVMPVMSRDSVPFGKMEIATFVGVGGLFVAGVALLAKSKSLLPVKDPRLAEALHFENQ